ncbi:MAG TPA: hypothetical protein VEN82_05620 [Actinomycetota bacterium]|nr:hypothetical protein [Actinomycetota bacterium]
MGDVTDKQLSIRYVGNAAGVKSTLAEIDRAHATWGSRISHTSSAVLGGMGRAFSTVGHVGVLAFGGIATAATLYGKQAFDAGVKSSQVSGQIVAGLTATHDASGMTAAGIDSLATSIQNYSGIQGVAVKAGESMLLTFRNVRNEAGKGNDIFTQATKTVADLSAKTGKDMTSSARIMGKALNDPIKGMSALTRVGVTFTTQQQNQIKALVASGHVMAAQKVILKNVSDSYSGAAAAMGKANPGAIIAAQMKQVEETVGQALIPLVSGLLKGLQPLLSTIGPVLAGLISALAPVFLQLVSAISPVVSILGGALSIVLKAIAPVIAGLAPYLAQLATVFAQIIVSLVPLIPPLGKLLIALLPLVVLVAQLMAAIDGLIARALVPIVGAIAVVAGAVVSFVIRWRTGWDAVKSIALTIWHGIQAAAGVVWMAIKAAIVTPFLAVKSAIVTTLGAIKVVLSVAWGAVKSVAQVQWLAIKAVIVTPFLAVKSVIVAALGAIKGVWNATWGALKAYVLGVWNGIVAIVQHAVDVVIGAINRIKSLVSGLGSSLGHSISSLVGPGFPHLAEGTRAWRGGLAVVGERGRELVWLPAGAQVVPSGESARLLGRAGGGAASPLGMGPFGGGRGASITTIVHLHVAGSVVTERELADRMRTLLLQMARNNGGRAYLS